MVLTLTLFELFVFPLCVLFFFSIKEPLDDGKTSVTVCSSDLPNCAENQEIEFRKCDEGKYVFFLKNLYYCGAYCVGKIFIFPLNVFFLLRLV